jgi:hypothetical protein
MNGCVGSTTGYPLRRSGAGDCPRTARAAEHERIGFATRIKYAISNIRWDLGRTQAIEDVMMRRIEEQVVTPLSGNLSDLSELANLKGCLARIEPQHPSAK